MDFQRANNYLQSGFWQRVVVPSSSRRGGFSDGHLHRLGGSSGSSLSLRCHIFNGHRRRDIASLGYSTCHQKGNWISHTPVATTTLRDYLHLNKYSPSTTLASGNVASTAGASDSA
jgi:hypothetical protein